MLDLFRWGEIFFANLIDIGEWLLQKPLAAAEALFLWFADFLEFYQFEIGSFQFGPSDSVIEFFDMLGSQSIGSLLFGGALTTVLGIKLIKFFLTLFG